MSFLLDPPLLVILGVLLVIFISNQRRRVQTGAVLTVIVVSVSVLLYLDIIRWPWFSGWVQGSDWMLNSGLGTGLTRSGGTDVLAVLLFGAYPLWLWLGMEAGRRMRGNANDD